MCGTNWLDPLIADTWTTDIDFTEPCTNHDKCYGNCEKTKKECDNTFCDELLAVCDRAYSSSRDTCEYLAKEYCTAVKKLGGGAYKKAQKKCCASGSW